ncbi:hypothetical protein M407DRAFT_23466 [Tulasnella calospora MUT 4182]|uniref:Uncharacterized protein n=1 Tax=Tulasnella calospora MUT 4182 TaxID=1051891 RepID=A0A0C3L0S1_9AGAM|nr:hypothetical protein M407DRAFT_23466 [Tulasnella calospora MUT 4182]
MTTHAPQGTAPLLRSGSFQALSLVTARPRGDVLDETSQSSTRTDEPIEGPRSQTPTRLPRTSVDDTQAPQGDDVPTSLPAGAASSLSQVKREALPSTHRRKSTGQSLRAIGNDISFPRIKPVIFPFVSLIGGIVLALGHHLFNQWADGRTV